VAATCCFIPCRNSSTVWTDRDGRNLATGENRHQATFLVRGLWRLGGRRMRFIVGWIPATTVRGANTVLRQTMGAYPLLRLLTLYTGLRIRPCPIQTSFPLVVTFYSGGRSAVECESCDNAPYFKTRHSKSKFYPRYKAGAGRGPHPLGGLAPDCAFSSHRTNSGPFRAAKAVSRTPDYEKRTHFERMFVLCSTLIAVPPNTVCSGSFI